MLTELSISNFKSLKNATIRLGPFSVFCGPNASGKSNLAEALDFLSVVFRAGLPQAVGQKGGFYNICFRRYRRAKGPISFALSGRQETKGGYREFQLSFSIRARSEAIRSEFLVVAESYTLTLQDGSDSPPFRMTISRQGESYVADAERDPSDRPFFPWGSLDQFNEFLSKVFKPGAQQLLFTPASAGIGLDSLIPFNIMTTHLQGLRVFQINSRTARQAGVPSVLEGMGRHGENLPIAIASFLRNAKVRSQFISWMQDIVPELDNLQTGYTETKQVGLFLQERGFGSPWYAEDLSDGTIMALALYVCLLAPEHRTIVIEEPENSLHPWILTRFLERCRSMSPRRQVILTTHSPQVVASATPEELFLIERHQGATVITPALESDQRLHDVIRKSALDLGQYWLSGAFGGVPTVSDDPDCGTPSQPGFGKGDES